MYLLPPFSRVFGFPCHKVIMVKRCCVYKCRGNYKNTATISVFRFPTNLELKNKWIKNFHREKEFTVNKESVVCAAHFHESEIIKEDAIEKDGVILKFPRILPKLKDGAIPTIFPSYPSYLSSNKPSTYERNNLEIRVNN